MEYVLRNTDIFDEQIGALFHQEIRANLGCFAAGKLINWLSVLTWTCCMTRDSRALTFHQVRPVKEN